MEYVVYQGLPSPRDNEMGWREWARYSDKSNAIREAKKLQYSRVDETNTVFTSLSATPWVTPAKT